MSSFNKEVFQKLYERYPNASIKYALENLIVQNNKCIANLSYLSQTQNNKKILELNEETLLSIRSYVEALKDFTYKFKAGYISRSAPLYSSYVDSQEIVNQVIEVIEYVKNQVVNNEPFIKKEGDKYLLDVEQFKKFVEEGKWFSNSNEKFLNKNDEKSPIQAHVGYMKHDICVEYSKNILKAFEPEDEMLIQNKEFIHKIKTGVAEQIKLYNDIEKHVLKTSRKEHDFLLKQVNLLAQRYNYKLNISTNLSSLDKTSEVAEAITTKKLLQTLPVIESNIKGLNKTYGKEINKILENVVFTFGYTAINEQSFYGLYFSKLPINVDGKIKTNISVRPASNANYVLTHEAQHALDNRAYHAYHGVAIKVLRDNNKKNAINNTASLYGSDLFLTNIAKELNPVMKFENTAIENQFEEMKELKKSINEFYGYQFLGDTNFDLKQIKVEPEYNELVKEISIIYGALMFNKILEHPNVKDSQIVKLIENDVGLRTVIFQGIKESIESSLLPHYIISRQLMLENDKSLDKNVFNETSTIPNVQNITPLKVANLKMLAEKANDKEMYFEDIIVAQQKVFEEIEFIMTLPALLSTISERPLENLENNFALKMLSEISNDDQFFMDTVKSFPKEKLPSNVLIINGQISFASAISIDKCPRHIKESFQYQKNTKQYMYMATPTEISSRFSQAFTQRDFFNEYKEPSKIKMRTKKFCHKASLIVNESICKYAHFISRHIEELTGADDLKYKLIEMGVTKKEKADFFNKPDVSTYKSLSPYEIDDAAQVLHKTLSSNLMKAILKVEDKSAEIEAFCKDNFHATYSMGQLGAKHTIRNNSCEKIKIHMKKYENQNIESISVDEIKKINELFKINTNKNIFIKKTEQIFQPNDNTSSLTTSTNDVVTQTCVNASKRINMINGNLNGTEKENKLKL